MLVYVIIFILVHNLVAIQALKRKKRYELQLNQIDGTLTTLEYQREALENANTNTEVLKTMGDAAKAFKAAHSELDVDKVQDLKDDIAEQQELAIEIANVISSPIGQDAMYDEDDLNNELEELLHENMDEDILKLPPTATNTLPKVPVGEPSIEAKCKQTILFLFLKYTNLIFLSLSL